MAGPQTRDVVSDDFPNPQLTQDGNDDSHWVVGFKAANKKEKDDEGEVLGYILSYVDEFAVIGAAEAVREVLDVVSAT